MYLRFFVPCSFNFFPSSLPPVFPSFFSWFLSVSPVTNHQRQKQSVSVLNHILADLVNSPRSGHTAAGVLDRWRSITLGGGWPGGESAGRDEGGSAPEMVRYSRPTAVRHADDLLVDRMVCIRYKSVYS